MSEVKQLESILNGIQDQFKSGVDAMNDAEKLLFTMKNLNKTRDGNSGDSSKSYSTFCNNLLSLLIQASTSCQKLARKIALVLGELEKVHPELVKTAINVKVTCTSETSHKQYMSTWSQLLDCSVVSRDLVAKNIAKFLTEIREQLYKHLSNIGDDGCSSGVQDQLHLYVKVFLQISQHLSSTIGDIVWKPKEEKHTDPNAVPESAVKDVEKIVSYLLQILDRSLIHIETRRRAATTLGYMVTLCDTESRTVEAVMKLIHCHKNRENASLGQLKTIEIIKEGDVKMDVKCGEVFLIHGLISCISVQIFTGKVGAAAETEKLKEESVCMHVFGLVQQHCLSPENMVNAYGAFSAFKTQLLWWDKLHKIKPSSENPINLRYAAEQTLSLVWTNLDSPIEGVSETIMQTFHIMIDTMAAASDGNKQGENYDDTISHVMGHVMQMSWQVKGKYSLCAMLLPYTSIATFLERYTDTWAQLLGCMSLNYMAPPATDMYKAITNATIKDKSWKSVCLDWLVQGVTHTESQTCYNVCHFWLPWTLKKVTDSYQSLLEKLKAGDVDKSNEERVLRNNEGVLRATISVCMTARKLQIIDVTDVPQLTLRQCLLNPSDDVRLDAFSLVCNSPKKSGYVSEYEVDLLKLSLPHAMTSDTPPFRQQLQSHIRALVVRLRDGALMCIKDMQGKKQTSRKKKSQAKKTIADPSETLELQLDLLRWIWDLCTQYLQPSSSFQRLKTCLEWMWALLDTLVYQPGKKKRRKGGCAETAGRLLSYAEEHGKLNLFTYDTMHSLLTCVQDGTDDVRELSCSILQEFFPDPLPLTPTTQKEATQNTKDSINVQSKQQEDESSSDAADQKQGPECELLEFAVQQCLQPRAHDANAGALMCKLIYHRYVIDNGKIFKQSLENNRVTLQLPVDTGYHGDPCLSYIQLLIGQLELSLSTGQVDMLLAAQSNPTHGILVALQHCMSTVQIKQPELWVPVITDLLDVTNKLVDIALNILGGKLNQGEGNLPSFEAMGLSIQSVIEESLGEDYQNDSTVLSPEYLLLMTWAWLNIRESSILYGKLVTLPLEKADASKPLGVLKTSQIQSMGDVMMKILTRCRHRGAIEGSGQGLVEYCRFLLLSDITELRAIPRSLVDRVLDQVVESSATSVTRRSAGLPLIVHSVLTSETKTKQNTILLYVVTRLLDIVASPLPTGEDQTLDLPHVHALNILKVLFAEASLAGSMITFTERACMLAIEGFSAPVWAVRNSATQIFSTLMNRMLGQKKTKDDSLHTITAQEFFTHFPALQPFLLKQLQHAVSEGNQAVLHPSLFPILAILSKLSLGVADTESELSGYLEAVQSLSNSPIYAVRELAAHAIVPLVSPGNLDQFLLELVLDLAINSDTCRSYNRTHGCLLQIHALLDTICERKDEGNVHDHLRQVLLERSWLGGEDNRCLVVKACYVQLMEKLCWNSGSIDHLANVIVKQSQDFTHMVGGWQLTKTVLKQWLTDNEDLLCDRVELCLSSESQDVHLVCLQTLKDITKRGNLNTEIAEQLQVRFKLC